LDAKLVIQSQYHATLEMLRQAILKCPEGIWNDRADQNPFWHVAYHALFYTHLYVQPTEKDFTAWDQHRTDYQFFGPVPWIPNHKPVFDPPYTREEILAYFELVQGQIDVRVAAGNLEDGSGFEWLPMNKLECHIYNIRHTQQHTAELYERLGSRAHIDLPWVGQVEKD
jgi:hypothetical protein